MPIYYPKCSININAKHARFTYTSDLDPFVDFMFNWSEVTCIKHWLVAEVILTAGAHGIPASLTAVPCFCCTPLLLGAVRDALWVWLKCHDGTGSAPVWSREASKNRARAARWAQERAAEAQTASILCLICLPFNAPLSASSPLHPSPEEKTATTWRASLFGGDTVGGLSHQYFIFAVRQHVLMMTSVWMAENSIMETLTLKSLRPVC